MCQQASASALEKKRSNGSVDYQSQIGGDLQESVYPGTGGIAHSPPAARASGVDFSLDLSDALLPQGGEVADDKSTMVRLLPRATSVSWRSSIAGLRPPATSGLLLDIFIAPSLHLELPEAPLPWNNDV